MLNSSLNLLFPLHSYVQVSRRKQIFTFLLDGSSTIGDVKSKISAVVAQHEIPEASDESLLLLDGKPTETDATLSSLAKAAGVSLHLVYSIGDNEYEPVEVEPTRPDA